MKKTFRCEECGKTIDVTDESIPNCCGKDMKIVPLDICTQPAHAEHSRPMDEENACDDGRAG